MSDKQNNREKVFKSLEEGVQAVFNSDKYKEYLSLMSKLHTYSAGNIALILNQMPKATMVNSYNRWQNDFNRYVKKGEHGLKILAPASHKTSVSTPLYKNGEPIVIDGKVITEESEITKKYFFPVTVFDVSQTDGTPVPQLTQNLDFTVSDFAKLLPKLEAISPFPIKFNSDLPETTKGLCNYKTEEIIVQANMSQAQTLKTIIHEIAHAKMHSPTVNSDLSKFEKEVQAESVAFVISNHFGIDTSDYSFPYIASWSENKELPELKNSLEAIRREANIIITALEQPSEDIEKTISKTQSKYAFKSLTAEETDLLSASHIPIEATTPDGESFFVKMPMQNLEQAESILTKNIIQKPAVHMSKYSKEENAEIIKNIKANVSILDYATKLGYSLVKKGQYYTMRNGDREYSSLRINSNGTSFWHNSEGIKGSIIDFVMHFENKDLPTVLSELSSYIGNTPIAQVVSNPTIIKDVTLETKKELVLPQKSNTMKNVFAYLTKTRKIESSIVTSWVKSKNLYQDKNNNCVFVSYSAVGNPEFASIRGTNTTYKFQSELPGGNYAHCLYINNNAKKLVVCESPIDLMSVQTILLKNGRDLSQYNFQSINGTTKIMAAKTVLDENKNIDKIIIALDNDKAGHSAAEKLRSEIEKSNTNINVIDFFPKSKDWNEEVVSLAETIKEKSIPLEELLAAAKEIAAAHNNQLEQPRFDRTVKAQEKE